MSDLESTAVCGGRTSVGVAGLIQSGGFGSFSKRYGLAAASLLEAEIVTADGQVRIVNEFQDPELFWALKGGGGGTFGIVSRLTLPYLTPLAPLFLRDDLVEVAINPDGKVWIERKGATHMERVAHLSIDRVLSNNLGQAIASVVGVQFSDKKPTVSGKIVWGDIAIRAQVVAPPIVEGGTRISSGCFAFG